MMCYYTATCNMRHRTKLHLFRCRELAHALGASWCMHGCHHTATPGYMHVGMHVCCMFILACMG